MHYVQMHRVGSIEMESKQSKEDASWDNGPSGITTINNNNNENLNLKCLIFGGGSKLGMKDELEEESKRRRRGSSTTRSGEEESSSSSSGTGTGTSNWLQLGLPNNTIITSTSPVLDLMLDLNLGMPIPSFLSPPPTTTTTTTTIHHPSIWFWLLPSLPQSVQPYLPHLCKSFLRIKDARMTVGLVMKYLANKLGLHTELQIEIRCRGQVLGQFLTLQHVRDYIWSPSYALTLLPNSSTTPHLMLLHYSSPSSSPPTYLPSIQRI